MPRSKRKSVFGILVLLLFAMIMQLPLTSLKAHGEDETSNPVSYYPRSDREDYQFETVASINGLSLAVDKSQAAIRLTDKTGMNWFSTPMDYNQDELSNSAAKMAMASLVQVAYADRTGNITTINGYAGSVRKSTYSVTDIKNGVRFTFVFEREGFTVPLEIALDEYGLNVSVVMDGIKETNENFRLTQVAVLPYFGAAKLGSNGYFLVPDGCGALIEYDKSNIYAEPYQQRIYGDELSTTRLESDGIKQQALLPVFGSKQGQNAFVGIITRGGARAIVSAKVAGADSGYSHIGVTFIYRESDMVFIEKKNQTVRIFETKHSAYDRHTVRYQFLNNEKANYVGMAETYRQYLVEEAGVIPKKEINPVYLNMLGGIKVTTNVLGFPVNRVQPLTGFDSAVEFLQALKAEGVDKIGLQYTNWQKGGDLHKVQTVVNPEGRLGGKSDFNALLQYCVDNEIMFYPDFNLTDIRKTSLGYGTNAAARSIQKQPAMQYQYRLNNNSAILSEGIFLLSPARFAKLTDRLIKSMDKWDISRIGLTSFGQKLYSDFGRNYVSRDEAEEIWGEVFSKFKKSGTEILLSSAAGYSLKYADIVTNTPGSSSKFDSTTKDVPFYQIALKGIIPVSVEAINFSADYRKGFLFAVETGSALQYEVFGENEHLLKESKFYKQITSGRMSDWLMKIAKDASEISPLFKAVAGAAISGHEELQPGVVQTTFSNGVDVIVNYNGYEVVHNGKTVEPLGFYWEG